ncbi:hypothetical protein HYR54_12715 [Candidatus Acetothermia bacterium]|nr:hypothetical protein [Candidatus Acetothermia bacterium]
MKVKNSLKLWVVLSLLAVSTAVAAGQASSFQVLVEEQASSYLFSVQGENVTSTRLEILGLNGRPIFDSGWILGQTVAWPLVTPTGRPAANGVYLYAIGVRDQKGKEERKLSKLAIFHELQASLSVPSIGEISQIGPSALPAGVKWQEKLGKDSVDNFRIQRRPGNGQPFQDLLILDNASRLTVAQICLAGDCRNVWPGGGGPTLAWLLTGNAGTTAGTNFLGTTDNQPLEMRVNNQRALRIEPNATSPNWIGGFSGNSVRAGVAGATIGGGGSGDVGRINKVLEEFGTVSGGFDNTAGAAWATVGGGAGNTASGTQATVGGGFSNTASALALSATVGGGGFNTVSNGYATVGGGFTNTAGGQFATVGGGKNNTAPETSSTVGGGFGNGATGLDSIVGGGNQNTAGASWATVGGGKINTALGISSTVGGGFSNAASGLDSTVPGGHQNFAQGNYSFAAGFRAKANDQGAFVWADSTDADFTSTAANQFSVRANGGARFITQLSTPTFTLAALQVETGATGGEAAWLRITSSANPQPVIKLLKHPSGTNNFLECSNFDSTTETTKCHINKDGAFVAGSDFAESLPAKDGKANYEPGDVLVLSVDRPGAVQKSNQPYDPRVAGVYSTRPAVLGAEKGGGETRVDPNEIPVAIVGIVPVKVTAENGEIQPGDLLTTSSVPGYAMKAKAVVVNGIAIYPTGTILGKAVEPLKSGAGVIKVLVMLR